ncbi:hypothetical protein A3A84_02775 [Candidatus Collierbacteria bacterium RIFCSPLOWO2_01_FULL_50_23]|uniref:DNA 3'-5' helicase n=1 Tax=Candidatus Collierbacteria bacterium RIFCSPHIGHO2_01_FULL_50_25 TaxID=1817722 RepID=A0A1F5EUI1_9BACT|nr:MAG: hypothetical protein A2703_01230 [Candidatus Collierbacteria bacterium RIFCSPHIGHO2_01_FULL_50_25]OGD74990.1 MAG: hypothetical protein A3A84_02775 [Candidatus Collierbacteria bacterium RIFCSPLOWO2_01_FULL_50_23]
MDIFENELNREQRSAVIHEGSPLLVLAGAGSGKTKVLIYRTIYLVNKLLVRPGEIVLLTFTNKAAEEMKQRVAKFGNMEGHLGFAGTFHTFCARLLRIYGEQIGLSPNFVIYDTDDSESALKMAVKQLSLDPKSNKPGMFLHLISRLKNDLATKEDLAASAADEFYRKLLSVWRVYDEILSKANAVDFDDLLVKTVKLLSLPLMQEKMAHRYNFVLVDEYQDTNKAQFQLTKLLATNPNGLMVVGDASQAIYSFRGADFRNLTLLASEYPTLTTIRLPRNYRSTQTILDAAYHVIANNVNHPVLKLEAEKALGEKIEMVEAIDEREEAVYVVKTAERLSQKSETLGVLYRTNAQSRAIEEALIKRRIDYKLVGGTRFYDRAEIKDLLAYLRVIFNQEDAVGWERIEKLGKRNRTKFEGWLAGSREVLIGKSPRELLEDIIEETGYMGRFDDRDEEDVARVENIKELLAVSGEFSKLTEFLESVALIQSDELAERKSGNVSVTMMTIHAAKGLEFDEVVIVGLEEGLLPHSRSLLQKEDVEEERRLMYVAMTRARSRLHLTLTHSRLMYGGRQATSPSRFLSEIPQELVRIAQKRYEEREVGRTVERKKDVDYDGRKIISDWETEGVMVGRPDRVRVEEETKADFDEIDAW